MKTAVEQFTLALIRAKAIKPSATKDFVKANTEALEMEKAEKIKAQIDVLSLLNDTHPLRINIMIRKLKEQLKELTFKSE